MDWEVFDDELPVPPHLEQLVNQRMAAGGYQSEDELLLDAMLALEDIERSGTELREELERRIGKAGTSLSRPLDREAFKSEARRRMAPPS